MNVPLNWLSEYVDLPQNETVLTNRLTYIGHMLDKVKEINGEKVIDLELRGNRSDMFGILGVARDVSAAFKTPFKTPPTQPLPPRDLKSPLVEVKSNATKLVERYTALTLKVAVSPSPKWLVDRLASLEIPSINNVVDITNFVMWETGQPMHAFDFAKLSGGKVILRQAKEGEQFQTIAQGQTVTLSPDDLVITDSDKPQALTMIGGLDSKVTDQTSEILLEAAVYNQANCRRSSRRLKIFTDSSVRHEKLLDPNQVQFALERALYLLEKLTGAQVTSQVSDYYPKPLSPKMIDLNMHEILRLTGVNVEAKEAEEILSYLGFSSKLIETYTKFAPGVTPYDTSVLSVTVPTFRTDVESSADLVEEVIRIRGYDQIPSIPLSGPVPNPSTYPSFALQEKLKDILTGLGLDEVITLSMIDNNLAGPDAIILVNPPDPDMATLRTSLVPGLVKYATRLLNLNQPRVSIFEIGKTFHKTKKDFKEDVKLTIALAGLDLLPHWTTQPKPVGIYHLKGIIDRLQSLLGINNLHCELQVTDNVYTAEINVNELLDTIPPFTNPYSVISSFPPVVEDFNLVLVGPYSKLEKKIYSLNPLIKDVQLMDKYGDKLTLRITFHSDQRQLSKIDIAPIRQRLEDI